MTSEEADDPDPPQSVADTDWFQRRDLHAIFAAIGRDGHEARIVGGAVRNTLMGLPISDVDFAATAEPEDVIRFADAAGLKAVPTGLSHGTVTIVSDGTPYEVTTLRHDVETDGRYAKVAFTRDWGADAARRDFTINALYADAEGCVLDPLGEGLADIKVRKVRFIGRAKDRICEDYLRILRFFRFTADYAQTPPDADGLAACIDGRGGLAKLSAERIRSELMRTLVTRRPHFALDALAETGLLISLLGGVVYREAFTRMVRLEDHLNLPPCPVRRLAALTVRIPEDAARLAQRLRLSNEEKSRLEIISRLDPALDAGMGEKAQKVALYELGESAFRDSVLAAWVAAGGVISPDGDASWRSLFELPERWTPPVFPVSGRDLIAHGVEAGPAMGDIMRRLEKRWIASDFSLMRDDLLADLSG